MTLHIRLTSQDEDLQGLRFRDSRYEKEKNDKESTTVSHVGEHLK